ncbi:aldehyde dehydrogenase family protein [Advenella mimigardefordensis]|uniref:Putative aldehyde dehydrogenase n=1 Tax=Advenella mimigardefordensis (strain DSM 17166 / LMG 22922 / DPN7) TaxID=1247726 RepID=W0P9F6_ADVMD|nr:aldehyde dehydrogenase family protein [Advenella mimigardefordensis]AHG63489.1 putative aldehyde dehydrogenase [Advenella mimigardefordensis DPN7]
MLKEQQNRVAGTIDTALFINNVAQAGEGESIRVVNPATEELVADFAGASIDQVDAAVVSAVNAFEQERWKDPQFRKDVLLRLADLIEENRDMLMDTLIQEIGTPINLTANHIDTPVAFLRWFAQQAVIDRTRHLGFNSSRTAVSTVVYRPVGVVAAITAFNYPLLIGLTKIGAALAAGCTAVLLSSPQAPLAVLQLGKLIRLAGFPAGVINILAGGAQVGERLTEHPGVAKVSFTGSVNVGRRVMQQAASGLRSVVLELGGKSAAILLPGVDFNKYAYSLHARYARNAGQGCGSPTRILVEASRYQEFAEISRQVYGRLKVGDPRKADTLLGPVINAAQRNRIEDGVKTAVQNGAEVLAGGGRPDIEKGWYVNPVLVGSLDNKAALAREEIFGPVSVVLTYKDVDEAIAIANDSPLGLKAYVFGATQECLQIVPKLHVGTVQINGGSPLRPDAPMTGYKHSGVGSEWGEDGLREFLRPQHIDCPLA